MLQRLPQSGHVDLHRRRAGRERSMLAKAEAREHAQVRLLSTQPRRRDRESARACQPPLRHWNHPASLNSDRAAARSSSKRSQVSHRSTTIQGRRAPSIRHDGTAQARTPCPSQPVHLRGVTCGLHQFPRVSRPVSICRRRAQSGRASSIAAAQSSPRASISFRSVSRR